MERGRVDGTAESEVFKGFLLNPFRAENRSRWLLAPAGWIQTAANAASLLRIQADE